jgi:ABC-2 type transport system ATP-binding protein
MIDVKQLTKRFGTLKAVDHLDLHVPRGELFCFLGPNGAGKTTTIKMMTGLMRPDGGSITINGIDIQRNPVEAKKIIGYIPDMPYMYERLTPQEYIEFVADLFDVPGRKVAETIRDEFARFGLTSYQTALIGDLSHGMRQRLIYVATFMHDPAVMLVDEPLVGLDPYTIRMIKDMLRAKTRGGMTIFLTTHILAVAEEIADRIGIISGGRLIALGTMNELKQQYGAADSLEDVFLKLTAGPNAERGTGNAEVGTGG